MSTLQIILIFQSIDKSNIFPNIFTDLNNKDKEDNQFGPIEVDTNNIVLDIDKEL